MTDTRPSDTVWYVSDHELVILSTVIRERRQARRLAYTFDPGLQLAEDLTRQAAT